MSKRKHEQESEKEANTDWSIDAYRTAHEPEEHWELRRAFMHRHQSFIPEDDLVCMAQVFVNVELLHCRYPLETMERLKELSHGVADEYKASRKNKLQRTFVSASDAAASKVQRKGPNQQVHQKKGPIQFVAGESSRKYKPVIPIRTIEDVYKNLILMNTDYETTRKEFERLNCGGQLELTVSKLENGESVAEIRIGKFALTKVIAVGDKAARKAVKITFFEEMVKHCHQIVRKKQAIHLTTTSNVGRKAIEGTVDHTGRKVIDTFQEQKIDSNNLGFKLLQKLGWSGGSLGSKNEGIVDPINCQIKIGRQGLGSGPAAKTQVKKKGKINTRNETYGIDINFYRQTMKNFRDSGIEYDMVFSSEFTKEERALFHNMAQQMGLKTRSFGSDDGGTRQLVLLGRKLSPHDLLERILVEKDPIFSEMYSVRVPPSLSSSECIVIN